MESVKKNFSHRKDQWKFITFEGIRLNHNKSQFTVILTNIITFFNNQRNYKSVVCRQYMLEISSYRYPVLFGHPM